MSACWIVQPRRRSNARSNRGQWFRATEPGEAIDLARKQPHATSAVGSTILRSAVVVFAFCLGTAYPAMAAESSGNIQVGVTIGGNHSALAKILAEKPKNYTWGAAEISLKREGFTPKKHLSVSGNIYWFEATLAGRREQIGVSRATGEIVRVMSVPHIEAVIDK